MKHGFTSWAVVAEAYREKRDHRKVPRLEQSPAFYVMKNDR